MRKISHDAKRFFFICANDLCVWPLRSLTTRRCCEISLSCCEDFKARPAHHLPLQLEQYHCNMTATTTGVIFRLRSIRLYCFALLIRILIYVLRVSINRKTPRFPAYYSVLYRNAHYSVTAMNYSVVTTK